MRRAEAIALCNGIIDPKQIESKGTLNNNKKKMKNKEEIRSGKHKPRNLNQRNEGESHLEMRAIRLVESDIRDREREFGGEISGIRVFFWNLERIDDERAVEETLERRADMVAALARQAWGKGFGEVSLPGHFSNSPLLFQSFVNKLLFTSVSENAAFHGCPFNMLSSTESDFHGPGEG